MKNKLTSQSIRMIAYLIAVIIVIVPLVIYVNLAAASGREVEASLQVTSGNSSVLAGKSFNTWSSEHIIWGITRNHQNLNAQNIERITISFDETGQLNATHHYQMYERPDFAGYRRDRDFRSSINLGEDMRLMYVRQYFDHTQSRNYVSIPGFRLEFDNEIDVDETDIDSYRTQGISFMREVVIDGAIYLTVSNADINQLISAAFNLAGSWADPVQSEQYSFSVTSGIFRIDGNEIRNMLPIEISSDNKNKVFDLFYLEQANCLALTVAENYNEIYTYIFHLETGEVDKHHIVTHDDINEETPLHAWEPYLFVTDNILIAVSGNALVCIEINASESIIRNPVRHGDGFDNESVSSLERFNPLILPENWVSRRQLSYENGIFHLAYFEDISSEDIDITDLHIKAYREGKLIFSGYIPLPHSMDGVSYEMPYAVRDDRAVQRWVDVYGAE